VLAEDMLKKHRDDGKTARTRGTSTVGARRRPSRDAAADDAGKARAPAKKTAAKKPSKPK